MKSGSKAERLLIGISGASGAPLAVELLQALRETEVETHLMITKGGERTLSMETGLALEEVKALADVCYHIDDLGAPPASGSWPNLGMVVIPCSMKTAAGIHSGYSDNLLLRAADVTLKEGRKLVLVAREAPLSTIHLRNLLELSQWGAVILPPAVSFYSWPESLADMTRQLAGRVASQFGLSLPSYRRWGEEIPAPGRGVTLARQVLGYPLRARAEALGEDWSVTVTGGCSPHIGSVSLAHWEDGELEVDTRLLSGHRDDVVGEKFARRLAEATGKTVSVACGIHYDRPTPPQLEEVVAQAEGLLEELEAAILRNLNLM